MRTMQRILLCGLCQFVFVVQMFAQGEIDDRKKILFTNEATPVVGLYSNGWGFGFIRGRRAAGQTKRLIDIEFSEVKHPKQLQRSGNGQQLIYGKLNDHYQLSIMYGRQKELFAKADKGSVAIRFSYSAGLCLGMEKPVYYEVDTSPNRMVYHQYAVERFSKQRSQTIYYSNTLLFTRGISETVFVPGLSVRLAYDIDFSNNLKRINALVLGASTQIFPRKIEIMASEENQWWFVSLYVAWRFGWVYSRW